MIENGKNVKIVLHNLKTKHSIEFFPLLFGREGGERRGIGMDSNKDHCLF